MVLLGWMKAYQLVSMLTELNTHRTQVSLYEVHGIPWLKYKSSSQGGSVNFRFVGNPSIGFSSQASFGCWGSEKRQVNRQLWFCR